jgi:hypothetical protein
MGIFNVQVCGTSLEPLVVEIPGGEIGQTWLIDLPGESTYCAQIISVSLESPSGFLPIAGPYETCYECLSSVGGPVFKFVICGDIQPIYISPQDLGYLPAIGDVLYMTYSFNGVETINKSCVSFVEVDYSNNPPLDTLYSLAPFVNCEVCEFLTTPRSGGTEYIECVICCDCGASGSTVTQVSPPHPVWTDGYGVPVTQLNMVTLGGMFGLNN